MGYSSGFLNKMIQVLSRKEAKDGKFGIDGNGIEWEEGPCLHANIDFTRGKSAMSAGALDAYAVKIVRMRWTNQINDRCRIKYNDQVFQIIPETFHADKPDNTLQFHMQLIVNE